MPEKFDYRLLPCSPPREKPLPSFWLSQPCEYATFRSTSELPASCDIVIIGSGIAGTLTTYHLLSANPDLRIVMLEAREFCSGATGRNGGHCKPDPYTGYETMKSRVGAELANETLNFEQSHLDIYQRLVDDESISCDLHITSSFDVCLNDEMAEIGRRNFHARCADFPNDMKPYLELSDPEHLTRLSGVKGGRWGCVYRVGSLHPYKLVTGMLRRCFELTRETGNLNLQTLTTVIDVDCREDGWNVITTRGSIVAPKVVVCCNAYASSVLPELANKIVPVKASCSALILPDPQPENTPGSQRMRQLFTSYSLKNTMSDFDYMISRQDHPRLLIVGGALETHEFRPEEWYGNTDDTTQIPGTEAYFKRFMPKHFVNYPEPESNIAHLWTGVLSLSADGLPWVGPVEARQPGLYMLGGFHGRGMVRAPGSAIAMAALILSGCQGAEASECLIAAGLPRAYIVTRERLESKENILTGGEKPVSRREEESILKAKL